MGADAIVDRDRVQFGKNQCDRLSSCEITENNKSTAKGTRTMARYVSLIQFTDQGIRNIKDTIKRGEAAMAEAEKMGMKVIEEFWTMGAYDIVALFEAPDDETVSAFLLKNGALGNAKSQTLRAFDKQEMEKILAKLK
jgi:uncharacterized protein with GYD domain